MLDKTEYQYITDILLKVAWNTQKSNLNRYLIYKAQHVSGIIFIRNTVKISQVINQFLVPSKPNGLNRITKIRYGYLWLGEKSDMVTYDWGRNQIWLPMTGGNWP